MSSQFTGPTQRGRQAGGIIDFNAAGEAAMAVVINGVTYQEADTAVAASGIWTNGSTAANSATSLAAAINGDLRSTKPAVTAYVSDAGDTVIVIADEVGPEGNFTITTDSASNCTVEAMSRGERPSQVEAYVGSHTVTTFDLLADEINIGLPFTPTDWLMHLRSSTGLEIEDTGVIAVVTASGKSRLRYNFAGAIDPSAGDVLTVLAWRKSPNALA